MASGVFRYVDIAVLLEERLDTYQLSPNDTPAYPPPANTASNLSLRRSPMAAACMRGISVSADGRRFIDKRYLGVRIGPQRVAPANP